MIQELTEEERKTIKYQLRPAIMIIYLTLAFLLLLNAGFYIGDTSSGLKYQLHINLGVLTVFLFISFLVARKHILDLRDGTKRVERKIINKKEHKIDYEAGSGMISTSPPRAKEMTAFDALSIIVDYVRYRVDEEFYIDCREGDEVAFHYAAKSNYCIKMELVKNNRINKMF